MNIDKAIEVLLTGQELSRPWLLKDYEDALLMAIEALRVVIKLEPDDPALDGALLLGETE